MPPFTELIPKSKAILLQLDIHGCTIWEHGSNSLCTADDVICCNDDVIIDGGGGRVVWTKVAIVL